MSILTGALLALAEKEFVAMEPAAQAFLLDELNKSASMLLSYVAGKMDPALTPEITNG